MIDHVVPSLTPDDKTGCQGWALAAGVSNADGALSINGPAW
jgi:hypothetical protein